MSGTTQRASQLSSNVIGGLPVSSLEGRTVALDVTPPTRPISPDGFALPASSLSSSALELSQFNRFVQHNVDLLSIIDQDQALVRRAQDAGFNTREELQQILIDAVAAAFPADSPLTRQFFTEHPEITRLLAVNPGRLRDTIAKDPALAASLADGSTIEVALQGLINAEAAKRTKDLGGLDRAFFDANPLAASYLLDHPSELERIGADTTEAAGNAFRTRYFYSRSVIEDAVVDRAAALLANPATFSDDFLAHDPAFSTVVVGTSRLEGRQDLPAYLRTHRGLALDGIHVRELLRSYEVDRAASKLPTGSVLDQDFLTRNVGVALVLNQSPEARDAVVADLSRLDALSAKTTSPSRLGNADLFFQIYRRDSDQGARLNFYF